MKHIVLIDDSNKDASEIKSILAKLRQDIPYEFRHFLNLQKGLQHIHSHPVDLLLLDLEFTKMNVTAAFFIDNIPPSIPVLIVSNLSHYQKPLSIKTNVKGFINKSHLSVDLLTFVQKNLGFPEKSTDIQKKFVFPSPNINHISEAVSLSEIRYIEFSNKHTYTIHLTNGTTKNIISLPFFRICSLLDEQNINYLLPITKNQIINLNYISSISKSPNGRYEIKLVNLPNIIFHVGKIHEEKLQSYFSLPKRKESQK